MGRPSVGQRRGPAKTARTRLTRFAARARSRRLAALARTFGLTLSIPAPILSFIAIFGAQGAPPSPWPWPWPWPMIAGVLAGSALWWLLLCTAVGALRGRVDARAQRRVGRASAAQLAGFALWQWAGLLRT